MKRLFLSIPGNIPVGIAVQIAVVLACGGAWAPAHAQRTAAGVMAVTPQTPEAIMARVAANQDRAEAERAHYVYVQHARVVSRKGARVMCEEITDSRITPAASGSHAELLKLDGRVWTKGRYESYTALPAAGAARSAAGGAAQPSAGERAAKGAATAETEESDHGSVDINIGDDDREMVESMRADLMRDTSRDGFNSRLFPLTTKSQAGYTFKLLGQERLNGRDVWHVEFAPKDKTEFDWKGDAWVDTAAYQPVVVSTEMSRKVPLAVRALLGTNVPGLGFTVVYAPQGEAGVWFPVSLGTEFKIHVLFFFRREIVIDAHNRDFEKTHVSARIVGTPVAQ